MGILERVNIQSNWFVKWRKRLPWKHKAIEGFSSKGGSLLVENPYLPQLRKIIEQIIEQKGSNYGEFFPILIAGEDNWETLKAAKVLSAELNRLMILTNYPAYFEEFAETMYEEQGLLVEVFEKHTAILAGVSRQAGRFKVILDFEQPKESEKVYQYKQLPCIPIFKKPWEKGLNLDIKVPFGYNTVIVSVDKTERKSPCLDRFERAFYENE